LGIIMAIMEQPDYYGQHPPYLAIAEDHVGAGGTLRTEVAAAAIMTPPFGLLVYSKSSDCAPGLRAIAHDLTAADWSLPSVNGPEPVCTEFAAIWSEIKGVESQVAVAERSFALRQVIHPTYSPGHLRQATMDELDLLAQWFMDFTNEALPEMYRNSLSQSRERIQGRIEQGFVYVWEDGECVSFAGLSRPTPRSIAIGPVYTPPQFRGKGYASSCVAQLSQLQLDQGRSFCTLFTDLTNPTSNKIYQNIGYRPVCDYTVYTFKN